MRKIGILGGTFNPIHNGHLLLAETARDLYELDEVIFIPSGCSYMKDPAEILPAETRYELVKLATLDNPFFRVSSMEIERSGNSYTCDTLSELKKAYPDAVLYHIVGADTLFSMEKWKNPEIIFENSVTLAAVRDGFDDDKLKKQAEYLRDKYHTDIFFLPSLHLEISSTDLRRRCRNGKSIRYLVAEPVRQYIKENQLYK